jgi:hypothetical protein
MMAKIHRHALKLEKQGNWEGAHQLIQEYEDKLACLIHGYLHRVEGDQGNAAYWYHRAGEPLPSNTLSEESERLLGMCR